MLEMVLIDLLRKKGILTEEEALKVSDIHTLYNKLISVGEISPVSEIDKEVLNELERLKKDKRKLDDKLVLLRRLAFRAESRILRDLIMKTIEKINEVGKGVR